MDGTKYGDKDMAKSIEAFCDNRGNLYTSAELAVVADIAAALGRVGDEGGLTSGVAKLILEKRKQIEKAFADFDQLTRAQQGQSTECSTALERDRRITSV